MVKLVLSHQKLSLFCFDLFFNKPLGVFANFEDWTLNDWGNLVAFVIPESPIRDFVLALGLKLVIWLLVTYILLVFLRQHWLIKYVILIIRTQFLHLTQSSLNWQLNINLWSLSCPIWLVRVCFILFIRVVKILVSKADFSKFAKIFTNMPVSDIVLF